MKKTVEKNEKQMKKTELIKDIKTEEKMDMIIAIINRGFSDYVVDAARDAGATGATIMYGRSSMSKQLVLKGVSLQSEKEIVIIVVKQKIRTKVMQEICDRTNLQDRGNGVCFSLPVSRVMGVSAFKKSDKKKPEKITTK